MKIKIRKRNGWWKTWMVYFNGTDGEYEVFLEKYPTLKEAYADAVSIVGVAA